jgi:membrane protease YdiL (CAAX protease family)
MLSIQTPSWTFGIFYVVRLPHDSAKEWRRKFSSLIVVVALDILISMILFPLDVVIEAIGGAVELVETDVNPLLSFVGAVLVAPLTEEIVFRLGLAPNLWFLFFSLFLASVQYAPKLLGDFFNDDGRFVLSAGICGFANGVVTATLTF